MRMPLISLLLLGLLSACGEAANQGGDAAAAIERPSKAGLCVACHGQNGISPIPGHPHIAGQDEAYLRDSMLKYRNGERAHAPMKAAVGALSDKDLADLARYYASLPRDGRPTTEQ